MIKYVLAILVLIATLAGLLLYVGDDATLTLSSSAEAGPLMMAPIVLSWQAVIVIFTGFVLAVVSLWSFLSWLWSLPARIKSGVGLRRRNQALEAMEEALLAGADGDALKARKKAERARNLITSADLGRIVSAQAAEASGDKTEAVAHYTAMLDSKKTRATGQHGLARNLLASGDLVGAMEQAQVAYADSKNARWAFDVLFQAQMADYQWVAASETLDKGDSRKHINKEVSRRRRAVLLSAEADRIKDNGDTEKAMELAVHAAKTCPEFSPGVALATTLLKPTGQIKKAISLIEKAWARQPHPALALALQDLIAGESDKARSKRIAALIKTNPTHKESHMLSAEEKLRQGQGVSALSELAPYLNLDSETEPPTARLCQLAGQIEETLGNQADARLWYERAATAPLDPDWSDLDPEGEAFDYSDADWRRLTFSFGDNGTLIHPRYEAGASRRRAGMAAIPVAAAAASAIAAEAKEELAPVVEEAAAIVAAPDTKIEDLVEESPVIEDTKIAEDKGVTAADVASEGAEQGDKMPIATAKEVSEESVSAAPLALAEEDIIIDAPKKDYGEVVAESAEANKEELSKRLDNLMDKPKAETVDEAISEIEAPIAALETVDVAKVDDVIEDAPDVEEIIQHVETKVAEVEDIVSEAMPSETLSADVVTLVKDAVAETLPVSEDTPSDVAPVEEPIVLDDAVVKVESAKAEAPEGVSPVSEPAKVEVTKIEKPKTGLWGFGRNKK